MKIENGVMLAGKIPKGLRDEFFKIAKAEGTYSLADAMRRAVALYVKTHGGKIEGVANVE